MNRDSLDVYWQDVVNHFDQPSAHTDFIRKCYAKNSLGYALLRYEKILSVHPTDDIAAKMRKRIIDLSGVITRNQNDGDIFRKLISLFRRWLM